MFCDEYSMDYRAIFHCTRRFKIAWYNSQNYFIKHKNEGANLTINNFKLTISDTSDTCFAKQDYCSTRMSRAKRINSGSMTRFCMGRETRGSETKSRCRQPTNKLMNIEAYVISYLGRPLYPDIFHFHCACV